jgi:hypothetical protein
MEFSATRRSSPGYLPANGPGAFPGGPSSQGGELLVAREARRVRVNALALVVVTYVVALAVMIVVGPSPEIWGVAIFLALGAIAPLQALFTWWLMRRRLWPGAETMRWANGAAAQAWKALDGGEPPANTELALSRLEGRTDDDAVAMRLSCLANSGRAEELRTGITAWQPTSPVGQARRVRYMSDLAWLDGVVDDLGTAWSAASDISDPDKRPEEQAKVLIEDARRLANASKDPFPRLVQAHRLLGPRATEFQTDIDRSERRRGTQRMALLSLIPVVIVAVVGVMVRTGTLG